MWAELVCLDHRVFQAPPERMELKVSQVVRDHQAL